MDTMEDIFSIFSADAQELDQELEKVITQWEHDAKEEVNRREEPKLSQNGGDRVAETGTEREKTSLVHFYPHAKKQREGDSDQR